MPALTKRLASLMGCMNWGVVASPNMTNAWKVEFITTG